MNPVEKILGGTKEYAEKKEKQFSERKEVWKGKMSEKAHKLHEKLENKGKELKEHKMGWDKD